jgi:metal-responsive CopG/Arc/MetJ family transcriptional regulator
MKEKTSITLSSDVLVKVNQLAGSKLSRSAFIEQVLRQYFRKLARFRSHASASRPGVRNRRNRPTCHYVG